MTRKSFMDKVLFSLPTAIIFLEYRSGDFYLVYTNQIARELIALDHIPEEEISQAFEEVDKKTVEQLLHIFSNNLRATIEGAHYKNRLDEHFILRITIERIDNGLLISGEKLLSDSAAPERYHHSAYDSLTGVLLRDSFLARAKEELLACREKNEDLALLIIDLDGFKKINDSLGHAEGDRALRKSAQGMARLIRYSDLLGRYGGDEFVLLVPGARKDFAKGVAERIISQLRNPTASVGVTLSGAEDSHSLEELIHLADQAMYRVKSDGRDGFYLSE